MTPTLLIDLISEQRYFISNLFTFSGTPAHANKETKYKKIFQYPIFEIPNRGYFSNYFVCMYVCNSDEELYTFRVFHTCCIDHQEIILADAFSSLLSVYINMLIGVFSLKCKIVCQIIDESTAMDS